MHKSCRTCPNVSPHLAGTLLCYTRSTWTCPIHHQLSSSELMCLCLWFHCSVSRDQACKRSRGHGRRVPQFMVLKTRHSILCKSKGVLDTSAIIDWTFKHEQPRVCAPTRTNILLMFPGQVAAPSGQGRLLHLSSESLWEAACRRATSATEPKKHMPYPWRANTGNPLMRAAAAQSSKLNPWRKLSCTSGSERVPPWKGPVVLSV
jgi:hypothetical protein